MAIRDEVLPVGPPVDLEWQIGRMRDIEEIRLAALAGEDVVVADERRSGKTTVALAALELLGRAGHLVFAVDAAENVATALDLTERLARQLGHQRSRPARAGAAWSARHLWSIGAGAAGLIEDDDTRAAVESILTAIRPEARGGAEQLDALLIEIGHEANRRGCRAVVLLDEVQAITHWDESGTMQAMLKGRLGRAHEQPSFVFAGSEPTIVRRLFAAGGMLQFHGIEHHLSRIADPDWHEGLSRAFRALRCTISDGAIAEILAESHGHPQRTMLIARETHRVVQTSSTPNDVARGHVVAASEPARRQHLWRIEVSK